MLVELVGHGRFISTIEMNQRMRRTFGEPKTTFSSICRRCCCGRCLAYPESAQWIQLKW